MTVPLRRTMTRENFFAWAERQEGRHEFDGFQPMAMTDDLYEGVGNCA